MEAQAKMLADLIATVSSMNAKLDDLHPVVLELNQCRPGVERAADALRAEVGDLRARVIDTTHPAEPAAGTDMPPPFLLSADAPSSSSKPASASKQTSAAAATSGIDVCTRASPLDTTGCVTAPVTATSGETELATATARATTRPAPVPAIGEPLEVAPVATIYTVDVVSAACSTECAAQPATVSTMTAFLPWSSVWSPASPTTSATKGVVSTECLVLPSSGQSSVTTHTTELVSELPARCATPALVHDSCCIPDEAFNDKSMAVDAPVNDTDEHLSLLAPLSGCDSSKSRPAPWPSFGDLPGGMHLPEPRPQLQKSEEGILSGLINRDNQVTVQHIDDSVSCGVHRSSFALFQWEIAGQLGGSANYASNNRTLDGKEVLLTWSHFLRIQILVLPSKEISFETDPMSLQRCISFSIRNCFGGEWFNGIRLQAYLLSQFIGCVTSCGFELLQWQMAWSHHLQCSEITSAEIKEHLLPDMCEKIIPATFMFVCYWAVGWSVLSTIVRSTEESILIDSMKRNKSTRSCQTLILAFLEVTTIQWLPKNQQWKIPWKMSSNHSPLPSGEPLEYSLEAIITVKNFLEDSLILLQHKASMRDVCTMFTPMLQPGLFPRLASNLLLGLMLGRGEIVWSHEHGIFPPWQAGSCLGHYRNALSLSKRPEQYQYSTNILGHKLTPKGVMLVTWLCAPWDPGGGILQVHAGGMGRPRRAASPFSLGASLGTSWFSTRGECHEL